MRAMDRIEDLWRAPVADSGVDPARVHRFNAVRSEWEGHGAQWWAPGHSVREPPLQLEEEDAAAADAQPPFEKHRVATRPIEGLEPRAAECALAAKLRHELEQARQWDACGPDVFGLRPLPSSPRN
jgi:hypothetical protein